MRQLLFAVVAGVVVGSLITLAMSLWGVGELNVLGMSAAAWSLTAVGTGLLAGVVTGLAVWAGERNRPISDLRRRRGWRGASR